MEAGLIAPEPMTGADRASLSRAAAEIEAIAAAGASQMIGAGPNVVTPRAERAHGTRAEARLRRAAIAGARALHRRAERQTPGKGEPYSGTMDFAQIRRSKQRCKQTKVSGTNNNGCRGVTV